MECITRFGRLKSMKEYREVKFESEEEKRKYESLLEVPNIETNIKRIVVAGEDPALKKFQTEIFNPLEDTPELYTELNKVADIKGLRKFINNYGLPFGKVLDGEEVKDVSLNVGDDRINFFFVMDVPFFFKELNEFKEAFKMWRMIESGDINNNDLAYYIGRLDASAIISQYFSLLFQFTDEVVKSGINPDSPIEDISKFVIEFTMKKPNAQKTSTFDIWHKFLNNSSVEDDLRKRIEKIRPKEFIMAVLSITLNEKSNEKRITYLKKIRNRENKDELKIVEGIKFNTLFDVAYYQLKQAVYKQMKFKICQECKQPFEPRHARQKFCPPTPSTKRSSCENAHNTRLKRQRRKEREKNI